MSITLGPRSDPFSISKNLNPSINQYSPKFQLIKDSSPQIVFDKTKRNTNLAMNPFKMKTFLSPQKYDIQKGVKLILSRSPTVKIVKKKSNQFEEQDLRKFDDLHLDKIKKNAPKFSLRDRYENNNFLDNPCLYTPGPGEYIIDQQSIKNQNSSFQEQTRINYWGSTQKLKLNDQQIPGVGDYTINPHSRSLSPFKQNNNVQNTFPKAPRFNDASFKNVSSNAHNKKISPSSYTLKPISSPIAKSLSPRFQNINKSLQESPSPFDYEIEQPTKIIKTKIPQYSFGKEQKLIYKIQPIPGPDNYNNLHKDKSEEKHKHYKYFNDSKRDLQVRSISPGPGRYEIKSKAVEGVQNKIPQKRTGKYGEDGILIFKEQVLVPNLTNYSPDKNKILKQNAIVKFPQSKRVDKDFESSRNPGVGDYNIQYKIKGEKIAKFSQAPRFNKSDDSDPIQEFSKIYKINN